MLSHALEKLVPNWYPERTAPDFPHPIKVPLCSEINGDSRHEGRCGGWDSNPHVPKDSAF
jgi:hypothetical protein